MKIIDMIKTIIIIPKSLNYLKKIETLLNKKDYTKSYIYLEKMNQLYKHNHKYIDYFMLKDYLDFLTGKHTELLGSLNRVDDLIGKNMDDYENLYKRKFIYSLRYIVYLLNDDTKSADNILRKINQLYFNTSNIRTRLRNRYPLYTTITLEKYFKEHNYYDMFSATKLNSIIACFPENMNDEIKRYERL